MTLYRLTGYDTQYDTDVWLSYFEWDTHNYEWSDDVEEAKLFYEEEVEFLMGLFDDTDITVEEVEYP